MLKFLIILFLIVYVAIRVGGYLFKLFFVSASEFQQQATGGRTKTRRGDLKIDNVPANKSRKNKGYEGGDYVDYEEVG